MSAQSTSFTVTLRSKLEKERRKEKREKRIILRSPFSVLLSISWYRCSDSEGWSLSFPIFLSHFEQLQSMRDRGSRRLVALSFCQS